MNNSVKKLSLPKKKNHPNFVINTKQLIYDFFVIYIQTYIYVIF